jgi:hypothetical protein
LEIKIRFSFDGRARLTRALAVGHKARKPNGFAGQMAVPPIGNILILLCWDSPPLGTIPLALDAGVGGQTDGIRCVIAFIEHGFCVDQIRGVEAFRETGIDTGHVFPRLRAGAAGGSGKREKPLIDGPKRSQNRV